MKATRAVLVGCGGISNAWLKPIKQMKDLEIVGLVDIREEATARVAQEYDLPQAVRGTDLESVLGCTEPDVVFNLTIPEAHAPVTLTALRHGCHVLSEKPLADSMASAREMVQAAQKAGKIFAVIQNRRYDARIRRLRSFIESGAIGPLTTVNCDFYIGAHFGGFRDHMRHVLIMDMAIHTFDAARFLSAADGKQVYCYEWNPAGSWYDQDASAIAVFQMSQGIVYTYRGSWCSEGLHTTWECDWRLIGENGSVRWDGADAFQAQVVTKRGGFFSEVQDVPVPEIDPGSKVGGHGGNISEFIRCVREGGTPETIASDNIKSLAMVFGAIESAETGQVAPVMP